MSDQKKYNRENLTPKEALDILIEGNQRFIHNLVQNRNAIQMVSETIKGQFPFAAILSCSDSRVPTELVFDQGLGDVFSVRLAGNIASLKAVASIEYAIKYLGSKLIVVLGHTSCGGIIGACDGIESENLGAIFSDIKPAVDAETTTKENRNSTNAQFINNVVHLNVEQQMKNILQYSALIRGLIREEKIGIAGGVYDLTNGKVTFYEEDKIFSANCQFESMKKLILEG